MISFGVCDNELDHPDLMQPVCTTVSSPCHAGRSLAGHPRCVSVGNEYGNMRLYTPIRSKTNALPRCVRQHSVQRGRPSLLDLLEKRAIEIVPPAQRESGFYSCYLLIPKEDGDLRTILDLRLLNYALMKRLFRMITLKQILSQISLKNLYNN